MEEAMPAIFSESGLSFQYPENWKLERDEIDNGWLATVHSPDTSFYMLCYRDDCPTAEELADEALVDLREAYPELEAEPGSTAIAGRVAHGHDVRFFLFDLTNTAWTRTFRTRNATVLVMWQVNDLEMEQHEPVLRAMVASLQAQ
jgi:hypothetical protein